MPLDVIRTFRAFMDFCYLVRRDMIDNDTLASIQDALDRFHHHRKVFLVLGVRPAGFSLPRQHSLTHYHHLIRLFGAPNGLCSSITESKHIKAVKQPWRRSNRCKALGQILITNQRLDKLAAARSDFEARGMLNGLVLTAACEHAGSHGLYPYIPLLSTNDYMNSKPRASSSHGDCGCRYAVCQCRRWSRRKRQRCG